MKTALRNLIWEELWMADLRSRYFGRLSARLRRTERVLAVVIAISSSSAAASLLAGHDTVAGWLAFATAIISAILAGYKFDKRVSVAASHGRQWLEIKSDYEMLWAQIGDLEEGDVVARHQELVKKHLPADELAMAEFAMNRKLYDSCFDEVAETRVRPASAVLLEAA